MKNFNSEVIVCIHEDRHSHLVGLKLAVLSIGAYSPQFKIIISCPNPPTDLVRWVSKLNNVEIISHPELANLNWNIKPSLLLKLLDKGYDSVIWVDSDIIFNNKILADIAKYSTESLVVTEEPYWGQFQGGSFRTLAWGLTLGRELKCTVNSGIVRVTQNHVSLLQAWCQMLNHPLYLSVQKMPAIQRPLHMIGDQEVLTALICSNIFKDIPVVMLKRGVDIAQCFGAAGYTPFERIKNFLSFKTPAMFHAMGAKPYLRENQPPYLLNKNNSVLKNLRNYYEYVSLEISPYLVIARKYSNQLDEDADWMRSKTVAAKLLNILSFNSANLIGLPISIIDSFTKRLRRALNINRFSTSGEHALTESPFDLKT